MGTPRETVAPAGAASRPGRSESWRARTAFALTVGLLASAWIGRAATSSDGAEVLSDTFGLLVTGRLESATVPPERPDPNFPSPHPFRSRYGAAPSLLPLPFLAPAWTVRRLLGPAGLDAAAALTWAAGAALAAWAFLRLARTFDVHASPLWAPAFLAGTYLWPYAADSYVEPWAAAALAVAAERLLGPASPGLRDGVLAGLAGTTAAYLKPILWVLAPVFVLAALLGGRGRSGVPRAAAGTAGSLALGLAAILSLNASLYGRATDFGYGYEGLPFDTPLATGLHGLLLSPGRGLLLFAPLAVLAPLTLRRLTPAARVLCGLVPLTLLLVVARWFSWHGASCWGPRLLLPVLPLLAAPAVLLPRTLARCAIALGIAVNLLGVLVAPGAFISYAELLRGEGTSRWPRAGSDRVSTVVLLAPPLGHAVFLARGAGLAVPAPWLGPRVAEGTPIPRPAAWLSPRLLRAAAKLRPVEPVSVGLLARIATAEALRGRPAVAARFAREALALDPGHRAAPTLRLLATGAGRAPAPPARPAGDPR